MNGPISPEANKSRKEITLEQLKKIETEGIDNVLKSITWSLLAYLCLTEAVRLSDESDLGLNSDQINKYKDWINKIKSAW